jgi:hypothetical protein
MVRWSSVCVHVEPKTRPRVGASVVSTCSCLVLEVSIDGRDNFEICPFMVQKRRKRAERMPGNTFRRRSLALVALVVPHHPQLRHRLIQLDQHLEEHATKLNTFCTKFL